MNTNKSIWHATTAFAARCAIALIESSSLAGDALHQGFRQPPDSAKPWGYWFWLNGNITRQGITADLGILWQPLFRADITDAVNPGENTLEVKVVNLWVNRMIGDEQLAEDSLRNPNGTLKEWPRWLQEGKPSPRGRYTFTSWRLWNKDAPLVESRLLGPVRLVSAKVVTLH